MFGCDGTPQIARVRPRDTVQRFASSKSNRNHSLAPIDPKRIRSVIATAISRRERFFVYDVRISPDRREIFSNTSITACAVRPAMPLSGSTIEPRDLRAAGKWMEDAAAVRDPGSSNGESGASGSFFEDIKRGAAMTFSFNLSPALFHPQRDPRTIHQIRCRFISFNVFSLMR